MDDEKYEFQQEVIEKGIIARSAHKRTVKGGRVRLHSDHLSKKELKKMSGAAKTYNLSQPMKWAEFKSMPDDLKVECIKQIRERFNVYDMNIADMLGIHNVTLSNYLKILGIRKKGNHQTDRKPDKDGFREWCNGTHLVTIDPLEEITECEPVPAPVPEIPVKRESAKAIPKSGQMHLDGRLEDILPTLTLLLGGAKVSLAVSWELLEGGVNNG